MLEYVEAKLAVYAYSPDGTKYWVKTATFECPVEECTSDCGETQVTERIVELPTDRTIRSVLSTELAAFDDKYIDIYCGQIELKLPSALEEAYGDRRKILLYSVEWE